MRALLAAVVILAVGLGTCSVVSADLFGAKVDATIMPGLYTYAYTVTNTSLASNFTLWVFGIELDNGCNVTSTVTPVGWSVDTTSAPHFITWMYQTSELPAGHSFSGFQATFNYTPSTQKFSALLNDTVTQSCPYVEGDVTIAAIPTTPEPAGIYVLLAGIGPFAAFALKRRGRV